MQTWDKQEKKRALRDKLKLFHESQYGNVKTLNQEEKGFVDQYRIREFFLTLLRNFNPEIHTAHCQQKVQDLIKKWNENNSTNQTTLEHLELEYFLICNRNRIVINPFLMQREMPDTGIYMLIREIQKLQFFYPLFSREYFEELLSSHNETFQTHLTSDLLLGSESSLYETIFHNYLGQKSAFNEALIIFFCFISFEDMAQNADKYGQLMLELFKAEVDVRPCFKSMDNNKKALVSGYIIQELRGNQDFSKIDDLNYINRLRYIQYQIQGMDVTNPTEDSNVFAYNAQQYNNNDVFGQLHSIEHFYHEVERVFAKLAPEVSFALYYLDQDITPEIWGQILDDCNAFYYKYSIYHHLSFMPVSSSILDFKFLHIAPWILILLSGLRPPRMVENLESVGYVKISEDLFNHYIDNIDDGSATYKEILFELYFHLPTDENLFGKMANIREQRQILITKLLEIIKRPGQELSPTCLDRFKSRRVKEDFGVFDLLTQAGNYAEFIIEEYLTLIQTDFYQNYYSLNGKENLFIAFSQLDGEKIKRLFINLQNYLTVSSKEKGYSKGRSLRFHLGILSLYLLQNQTCPNFDSIANYVLTTFQEAKKMVAEKSEFFSWFDISFDTFNIRRDVYDKQALLTYCICKVLERGDIEFKRTYFNDIKSNLSLVEVVLFNKEAKIDSIIIEEFLGEDILDNAGHLQKDAFILIRTGYPEYGLKFIEAIKQRGKTYDDIAKNLEFEALVNLKRFSDARCLLSQFQDKHRNYSKEGLLLYFEEKYYEAEMVFGEFFKNQQPSVFDVVNYSAVLLRNEKHTEARILLEQYQDQYDNDPLLFLNLGIAYLPEDKFKSLFYLSMAKKLKPSDENITLSLLANLKDLIPAFDQFFEEYDFNPAINEFSKEYIEVVQTSLTKTAALQISELEAAIVKEIYEAIEERQNDPKRLSEQSETELSDDIKGIVGAVFKRDGIIVEREHPGGRAIQNIGEIDLFIYRHESQEILAVGENKLWGPDNFNKQIKQLLGYMQPDKGFGFTIIFNKNTHLKTVVEGREEILKNFSVEKEGNKCFEVKGPIFVVENWIPGIKDVLITHHENPEKRDSRLRLYHFIANCKNEERVEAARQART